MKKWFTLMSLLAVLALLVACQPKGEVANSPETAKKEATKKLALIMQVNLGTFSAQYIAGVKEQAEKLGADVTVFTADVSRSVEHGRRVGPARDLYYRKQWLWPEHTGQ